MIPQELMDQITAVHRDFRSVTVAASEMLDRMPTEERTSSGAGAFLTALLALDLYLTADIQQLQLPEEQRCVFLAQVATVGAEAAGVIAL